MNTFTCDLCKLETPHREGDKVYLGDGRVSGLMCKACYEEAQPLALRRAAENIAKHTSAPMFGHNDEPPYSWPGRTALEQCQRCEECGCLAPDALLNVRFKAVCAKCYSDPDGETGRITTSTPILNEKGEQIPTRHEVTAHPCPVDAADDLAKAKSCPICGLLWPCCYPTHNVTESPDSVRPDSCNSELPTPCCTDNPLSVARALPVLIEANGHSRIVVTYEVPKELMQEFRAHFARPVDLHALYPPLLMQYEPPPPDNRKADEFMHKLVEDMRKQRNTTILFPRHDPLDVKVAKLHLEPGDIIVMTYPDASLANMTAMVAVAKAMGDATGHPVVHGSEGFNVTTIIDYLRQRGYRVEKECPQCGWVAGKTHDKECCFTQACMKVGEKIEQLPCGHMKCDCKGRL